MLMVALGVFSKMVWAASGLWFSVGFEAERPRTDPKLY